MASTQTALLLNYADTVMETTQESAPLRAITGSIIPHILLIVFQIFTLAGPRYQGRCVVTCCITLTLVVVCHSTTFTHDLGVANFVSLAWPHYLMNMAFFVFGSPGGPEADLWRVDRPPHEATMFKAFSLQKIKWATAILLALRGIRWNWEVPHLPKRTQPGKREGIVRFLLLQIVDLVWLMTMMALFTQLGSRLFFIDPATGQLYADSKKITLPQGNGLVNLALRFVYGATPYFCINGGYVFLSIISVVMGITVPEVSQSHSNCSLGDFLPLLHTLLCME